jgi:transcription elongation GreA/GreB family factor
VNYTLLGVWDSDPDNRLISYKTPLGQALLSKKAGDRVKLKLSGSEHEYVIAGISRYVDARN